jgi:hypothetical protein
MNALEVNGVRIEATAIRAESARLRQQALSNGDKVTLDDSLRFSDQAEELLIERVLLDREAARMGISVRLKQLTRGVTQGTQRTGKRLPEWHPTRYFHFCPVGLRPSFPPLSRTRQGAKA